MKARIPDHVDGCPYGCCKVATQLRRSSRRYYNRVRRSLRTAREDRALEALRDQTLEDVAAAIREDEVLARAKPDA